MSGAKGIDDLLLMGRRPRVRVFHRAPTALTERRRPYDLDAPVPARKGSSLAEARATTRSAIAEFVMDLPAQAGKAQVISSDPGVGKTTAVAAEIATNAIEARVGVGTIALARELANDHGYQLFEARGPGNCQRWEVVRELGRGGHRVGGIACGSPEFPRCPARMSCAYYAQGDQRGPRVGATEHIFNPLFLKGGELVVLDDAHLARALVGRKEVAASGLARAVAVFGAAGKGPELALVRLLQQTIAQVPSGGLLGPAVWDTMSAAAEELGVDLAGTVAAVPSIVPEPVGGWSTFASVEEARAAPPGALADVALALQEELSAFLAGDDFNSRLRLRPDRIEIGTVKTPSLGKLPLLVLDATPVPSLIAQLCRSHERLPAVEARTELPASVSVVQYASAGNGHLAMVEGTTPALEAEIERERRLWPVASPSDEAAIVYKSSRAAFFELGFAEGQVLTFGATRGTNVLARIRRLHIGGRPMPPTDDLHFLAQVLHHAEEPVSPELVLRPAAYAGQPYGIDVVDYADPRMAALLQGERESELGQVIQRARLAEITDREWVRVCIHTNHPIPGLRACQETTVRRVKEVGGEGASSSTHRGMRRGGG